MKKAEVKIGGKYYANVSGKKCEVRIDAERPRGGWDATNLATGKTIQIKSAQRLQGEARRLRGQAKLAKEEVPATVDEVSPAAEATKPAGVLKKPRGKKEVIEAVTATTTDSTTNATSATNATKATTKKVKEPTEPKDKKLSCLSAAVKVLGEAGQPLNAKEMIAAMETKGYWKSPGGKTPHATLYSAILRDLSKGDGSQFVKTERGRFAARS